MRAFYGKGIGEEGDGKQRQCSVSFLCRLTQAVAAKGKKKFASAAPAKGGGRQDSVRKNKLTFARCLAIVRSVTGGTHKGDGE